MRFDDDVDLRRQQELRHLFEPKATQFSIEYAVRVTAANFAFLIKCTSDDEYKFSITYEADYAMIRKMRKFSARTRIDDDKTEITWFGYAILVLYG